MYDQYQRQNESPIEKVQREATEQSMLRAQQKMPVTLVEHMTDPRAAQLQMLFASLDEYGKKVAIAQISALVKLHKDSNHG